MQSLPKVDAIGLSLGRAHAGWLPVSLRLGDFNLHVEASNVLNDPLEELVDLTAFARSSQSGFRRVCFWEEPGGYALDLQHMAFGTVLVSLQKAAEFFPPMNAAPMSKTFRCVCPQVPLYFAFRSALADWVARRSAGLEENWGRRSAVTSRIGALGEPLGAA